VSRLTSGGHSARSYPGRRQVQPLRQQLAGETQLPHAPLGFKDGPKTQGREPHDDERSHWRPEPEASRVQPRLM